MTQQNRIVIIGGHGKVALHAAGELQKVGYSVDSIIRKPEQSETVQAAGGNPVVLDIESASVDTLAETFSGAEAVVFSAGAGGGSPERTHAVDYEAATRAMQAAEQANVKRFIMVSFAGADNYTELFDPADSMYHYGKAKHDADAKLRESTLNYTILGPGLLTQEPATGKIQRAETVGQDFPDDKRVTSRENVAQVIAHVIKDNTAVRQTLDFYDGETPIAEATH